MMLAGQLDLFTGVTAETAPPAVPVHRAAAPLGPGEVLYTAFRGQGDCDDCWQAQAAADVEGGPVPFRRRATTVRKTATTRTLLCEPHKLDRQDTDTEVER